MVVSPRCIWVRRQNSRNFWHVSCSWRFQNARSKGRHTFSSQMTCQW